MGPTGLDAVALAHRVPADSEQVRRAVALLESQGFIRTGPTGIDVLDVHGLRQLAAKDGATGDES